LEIDVARFPHYHRHNDDGMSNNDKEKERNKFQQLSGIMVVVDRNISLTPDSLHAKRSSTIPGSMAWNPPYFSIQPSIPRVW
jgi:hypothetical protein